MIIEFAGPTELGQYLQEPSTPQLILDRWTRCPHTDEFERGKTTPMVWAERFVRDWDVRLPPDVFLEKFTTWARRVLPGARELLEALKPRYRLGALSNSNELHWKRNREELRITEMFEFALSSHQLGLCKPDPEIFKVALEHARVSTPEAIMFFDDLPANVAAAKSVGLRAFEVRGVDSLRRRLAREGVL